MKKSMILVAMLSVGYAAAQTTNNYDERVGINTDTPSATLNVKTKNNTTSPKNLELENAGGTKLMTVLNGGNVGINTDAPAEKLHISNGKLLSEGGNSGVIIRRNGEVGPFIQFENPDKTIPAGVAAGKEPVSKWRIFNMTSSYGNSLRFWAYGTNASGAEVNLKSRIVIADNGNFGVGEFATGTIPTERLHIESGNVKVNDLPSNAGAATDKVVVVDNTGVLKSVERSTISGTSGITAEVDGIIGNEVTNATANGGLVRSGAGTATSPYTLGLPAGTAVGQTMVWNGTSWEVKTPEAAGTLQALTGEVEVVDDINVDSWTANDKNYFALIQTGTGTIDLPAPASYKGKIIAVNNQSGTTLNFGTNNPKNYSTVESGGGFLLISNGTRWYVIGGGI